MNKIYRTLLIVFLIISSVPLVPTVSEAASQTYEMDITDAAGSKVFTSETEQTKEWTVKIPVPNATITKVELIAGTSGSYGSIDSYGTPTTQNGETQVEVTVRGKTINVPAKDVTGWYGAINTHFYSTPGNAIWRYSDGKNWQINTVDYNTGNAVPYEKALGQNPNSSGLMMNPPNRTVTTMSRYGPNGSGLLSNASSVAWYAGSTHIENNTQIDANTVSIGEVISTDPLALNQPKKVDSVNNHYTISYNIPNNFYSTISNPPSEVGTGANVIGRNYRIENKYNLKAKTLPSTTYKYGGKIRVTYTPPTVPYVVTTCTCTPDSVKFNNADVSVSLKVDGQASNVSSISTISYWMIYARTEDAREYYSQKITSQSLAASKTFSFTIPASKLVGESYTEKFVTTTRIFFTDGTYKDNTKECTTLVYKDVPPPPSTPSPVMDNNEPPTANIIAPTESKAGDPVNVSGFGSRDPEDGTNITYQWYHCTVNESTNYCGNLVTDHSTRDGTINFTREGRYYIYLGVLDTQGKGGFATQLITVLPPSPTANVGATGQLKENRPILLDGSASSSPVAYPINWSTARWTVEPIFGGTASDIVTQGALTGTKSIYALFKKGGDYRVTYTVTNSVGLTDTKSITLTIQNDEAPVAQISTIEKNYRDPDNANKASFALQGAAYSPDGDMLSTHELFSVYDADNDGSFTDETNSTPVTINAVTGKGMLQVNKVGKYRITYRVRETFDPGVFAGSIAAANYLWSFPYSFTVEVDNVAPSTSLSAEKQYKADVYINLGDLSPATKQYVINNVSNMETELRGNLVDTDITYGEWDETVEQDYLKDSGYKLNHDVSWRTNLDQKYFVGITDTITPDGEAAGTAGLNLKPLAVSTTPFEGSVHSAVITSNKTVYVLYKYPNGGKTYTYYLASVAGGRGTATKSSSGFTYNDDNSPSYYRTTADPLKLDTSGYPYTYMNKENYETWDDGYRTNFYLYSPMRLGTIQMTGFEKYQQMFSKPSTINGIPTIWSSMYLSAVGYWEQQANYWRTSSNWNPPSYGNPGTSVHHQYTEGYTVNGSSYWVGTHNSNIYGSSRFNLMIRYNNNDAYYYPYTNSMFSYPLSDSLVVIATKYNSMSYWKLTFKNGSLISEEELVGSSVNSMFPMKYNSGTNKLYFKQQSYNYDLQNYQDSVVEYDMAAKTVSWSKAAKPGITIQDIGFETNGEPLYLFTMSDTNMVYLSKDNDPGIPSNDLLFSYSDANNTVSYNDSGAYAWFTAHMTYNDTKGTIYKIHKVEPDGTYSYKVLSSTDGTKVEGLVLKPNGDIFIVGRNTTGKFYAVESEGYIYHPTTYPDAFHPSYHNEWKIDSAGNVLLLNYPDSVSARSYRFNTSTHQFTLLNTYLEYGGALYDYKNTSHGNIHMAAREVIQSGGQSYIRASYKGQLLLERQLSYYWLVPSVDVDNSGYYYTAVTIQNSGNYSTFVKSNSPSLAGVPDVTFLYGYQQTRIKVINNVPYIYAKRSADTGIDIYKLIKSGSGTSSYYNVTNAGSIQNKDISLNKLEWIGDTMSVFSGSKTNSNKVSSPSVVDSYAIDMDFNGLEMDLASGAGKGGDGYPIYPTSYDREAGGYFSATYQYNSGTNRYEDTFVVFDKATKKHYKATNSRTTNVQMNVTQRHGKFFVVLQPYNSTATLYTVTKNGLTYITPVYPKSGTNLQHVEFVQDEEGYSYILASYQNPSTYVYTYSLFHNRSGAFVEVPLSVGNLNYAKLEVNQGYVFVFPSYYYSNTGLNVYYGKIGTLPTLSSINLFRGQSNYSGSGHFSYENGGLSLIYAQRLRNSNGDYYYKSMFYSTKLTGALPASDYMYDDYYLYATGPDGYYLFNKSDYSLIDAGKGAPALFKGKGKAIQITFDSWTLKPSVKVVKGVNLSANDPDFVNTLGRDGIKPVFIGTNIDDQAASINQVMNGITINLAIGIQYSLDELVQHILTEIKDSSPSSAQYHTLNSQISYQPFYYDYESDPSIASQWKFYHDPSVFDNSQGRITDHGIFRSTPYTSFSRVGKYEIVYIAKDNPGVTAYQKWSEEPAKRAVFYIHRKPLAQFQVKLFQAGSSGNQASVSVIDTSYDSDHSISMANKGIVQRNWKWKEVGASEWNPGLPDVLPMNRNYLITLTVVDVEGAESDPHTVTFTTSSVTPNTAPTANITVPSSTSSASPTMFRTLRPTIQWTFSDVDGQTQQKYRAFIYNTSNGLLLASGEISSALTQWTATTNLPENVTMYVQVQVFDGVDWSALSARKYMRIKLNTAPVAAMTNPNGSQAAPTIFATLRPTLQWTQTDVDAGTVFTAFQIEVMNEANTSTILDSGQISQNTGSTSRSWTTATNLPAGQKMRVRVRIYDGTDWSNWSAQTWMYINRPPTVNFDWSPNPVWEGDTVSLRNLSGDPDGDPISSTWEVTAPDNNVAVYSTTNVSKKFAIRGNYIVKLTVSDGKRSSTLTKTIQALELTINPEVSHTPQWLSHHQQSGHNTATVPMDFYSGEIFVVTADSSGYPVRKVIAWIDAIGKDGNQLLVSTDLTIQNTATRYSGELFDDRFISITEGLPEGELPIHFRIEYTNGVIKEESVPVMIIGNVLGAVGVHRRQ